MSEQTPESGSIEAVGMELEKLTDWRLVLANVFLFQILGVIALFEVRILQPDLAILSTSIGITAVGAALLWGLRRSRARPARMELKWVRGREGPNVIEVSYTGPRNKRREGLVVENVDARPNDSLLGPGTSRYTPVVPVGGTRSSLILSFRDTKKFSLGLGFATLEEMQRAYGELKG